MTELDLNYLNHDLIYVISRSSDSKYHCKICHINLWHSKLDNTIYQILHNGVVIVLNLTCNEFLIKKLLE